MKSLKTQLIFSHVLPQVLILPALVLVLGLIFESQILLAEVSNSLRMAALAAAQQAKEQSDIWQDPSQSEAFARLVSGLQGREIVLLEPNGSLVGSNQSIQGGFGPLSKEDLEIMRRGEAIIKSRYSLLPDEMAVDAWAPVINAEKAVVGIVWVTDRLGQVYDNFYTIRRYELAALLISLIAAAVLGIFLAGRIERQLQAVTNAIEQVAAGEGRREGEELLPSKTRQEGTPIEFTRVLSAVQELSDRLQASEAARKRLLANLVHEVARPLGAIQAAVHALQRGAVEDPALRQKLLGGMDEQIERVKPMIENLASLYALSGSPVEIHKQKVDLIEWLTSVLVTWQAAAQNRGLSWDYDPPGELPPVAIDPDRMAQVVGNLVGNAIQYTPEGGWVRIRAGEQQEWVWISVEDNGIGITDEEREKIFEPLYRGPRARRFPQGMGLGLSIALDIVRLHGGQLEVTSEAGGGSRFTIYLPIDPDRNQAEMQKSLDSDIP